jgi:hypothetical protein
MLVGKVLNSLAGQGDMWFFTESKIAVTFHTVTKIERTCNWAVVNDHLIERKATDR